MSAIVKGPNPLLRIGHNVIVIGRKRSRPQNISKRPRKIIKVVITTQEKKSALPVKGHSHTCQSCINKEASASLRHATHLLIERSFGFPVGEERERMTHLLERTFCFSVSYLLALY
jgi:hypothetical protein